MKDYILFIAAMLIFGTNGVFASMLDMSGSQLVLMRTLIGSVILFIIVLLTRSKLSGEVLRREKRRLLLAGICLGANWVLLFEAYNLMNVSLATLTYYTAPVMVLVLAPFVLGEKQHGRAHDGGAGQLTGVQFHESVSSLEFPKIYQSPAAVKPADSMVSSSSA